jgi:hypothetical protein
LYASNATITKLWLVTTNKGWRQIVKLLKDNFFLNLENGEEYSIIIKIPYQNLMLDR